MLKSFYQGELIEAGCDEAGRGCYAGPVFAAAVILPKDFTHPFLNDSKKLTVEQRNALRPIIEKEAISFAVASVDNDEIDIIIIKGDGEYSSIAAASVLAKTYRDEYMLKLHEEFPAYHWKNNKGYGTEAHRNAIAEQGLCKYHRKSFRLLPEQYELFD